MSARLAAKRAASLGDKSFRLEILIPEPPADHLQTLLWLVVRNLNGWLASSSTRPRATPNTYRMPSGAYRRKRERTCAAYSPCGMAIDLPHALLRALIRNMPGPLKGTEPA
jgi:hypothetical protein